MRSDHPATIYALCEPDTNEVRYIGQTLTPIDVRYRQHVRSSRWGYEKNAAKREWIAGLLANGEEPACVVLEVCQFWNVDAREQWWIDQHAGEKLTNMSGHSNRKKVIRE